MASGKAGRRALAADDVGVSIERWQADTAVRKDHETGTGPIGLLFNSLIELLGLILTDMKTRPDVSRHCQSLETSSAALFFWGNDLGVSQGELDEMLRNSVQLRDTCLLVLVSIGQFMVSSFVRLLSSKDRQTEVLDSAGIAPALEQAMNIVDQKHSHTYQPKQDEEVLCRTLRTKIDTLMMLGPSLAFPAEESFHHEEPRAIEHVEKHLPEQAYINSVAQRFPLAASTVVTHLGKLNWERYNHMLRLQRNAIEREPEMTVMEKAKTIFHDSALGSSVPAQSEAGPNTTRSPPLPQSIYAPSMVSSRAEASHRRLPPLPPQARSGQPFTCTICNMTVRYQRTKPWKKHVFDDILAYACLFDECSVAHVFFEDRHAMMSHLEQRHGLDVLTSEVTCPLCLKYTSGNRDALSLHFARHMEEIALAILPSGVDSDDESLNDTPSEAEAHIEEHPSSDGKAAEEAATVHDFDSVLSICASFGDDDDESYRAIAKDIQRANENTNNNAESTNELNDEKVEGNEVTRCVCGNQKSPGLLLNEAKSGSALLDSDDPDGIVSGLFVQCDICKVWQHGGCVGILDEAASPDEYFCEECHQDLHEVMTNSSGRRYSRYLPIHDLRSRKVMNWRAHEGSENALGKEHPDTLTSMDNLASTYSKQGRLEEAEMLCRQLLKGIEKKRGDEHPDTLTSMYDLASTYSKQGRLEEAETLHRQALEGMEMAVEHVHPTRIDSISKLARVMCDQGKYEEAELVYRRTLKTMERMVEENHPSRIRRISCISDLARVLCDQAKYEEAEMLHRQALEKSEEVLGKEHTATLTSVFSLASLLHQQHQYDESLSLYKRAISGYQRVFGPKHPTTVLCSEHYSDLVQEMQLQTSKGQ